MRLADPLLPRKLHREDNVVTDSFINSKRDKRQIKHSAFVSRISKASTSSSTKQKKRRRPSKKLVTTLESLGDALEDIQAQMDEEDEWEGVDSGDEARQQGKVRHKSLKTRPGALKRKEKIVRGEMERFGVSLAQLAGVAAAAGTGAGTGTGGAEKMDADMGGKQGTGVETQTQGQGTSSRWAALRGFISATMEQNPAFLNKT